MTDQRNQVDFCPTAGRAGDNLDQTALVHTERGEQGSSLAHLVYRVGSQRDAYRSPMPSQSSEPIPTAD